MASSCSLPEQSGHLAQRRLARESRSRPWLANSVLAGRESLNSCRRVVVAVRAASSSFVSRLPRKTGSSASPPAWVSRLSLQVEVSSAPSESEVGFAGGSAFSVAGLTGDSVDPGLVATALPKSGSGFGSAGGSSGGLGAGVTSVSPPFAASGVGLGCKLKSTLERVGVGGGRVRRALGLAVPGARQLSGVSSLVLRAPSRNFGYEKEPPVAAVSSVSARLKHVGRVCFGRKVRKKVTFALHVRVCSVDSDADRTSILAECCGVPVEQDPCLLASYPEVEDLPPRLSFADWESSQLALRLAAGL